MDSTGYLRALTALLFLAASAYLGVWLYAALA